MFVVQFYNRRSFFTVRFFGNGPFPSTLVPSAVMQIVTFFKLKKIDRWNSPSEDQPSNVPFWRGEPDFGSRACFLIMLMYRYTLGSEILTAAEI